MALRNLIKDNSTIFKFVVTIQELLYKITTIISPKLNTTLRFRQANGYFPDYKNPKSFTEKLVSLKLNNYIKNPLVIQCADKYLVRDYVTICGYAHLLNNLIAVYNNVDEIDWEMLPNQFALKWNFGAGMNIICHDKKTLNLSSTIKQLKRWGRSKYWLSHSEMQYKYAPKKLLCEKYLSAGKIGDPIVDFKVYCFNGNPLAILVMHDRGKGVKTEFFDKYWNPLINTKKYKSPEITTPKPNCLEDIISCCSDLSKPFPFVRIDFYIINGELVFGEMTFTPAGGILTSQTLINGKEMGEFLKL